jgi:hypothetical protein
MTRRVGKALPQFPAALHVPLPVRVSGKVGAVNCDGVSHFRVDGMQRGQNLDDAGVELGLVLAELGREPVGGVGGRDRAQHVPQPWVVLDQRHRPRPGREPVQLLISARPTIARSG